MPGDDSVTGPCFGECAQCFNQLERPFWDTICFACQESLKAELAEDDEWEDEYERVPYADEENA